MIFLFEKFQKKQAHMGTVTFKLDKWNNWPGVCIHMNETIATNVNSVLAQRPTAMQSLTPKERALYLLGKVLTWRCLASLVMSLTLIAIPLSCSLIPILGVIFVVVCILIPTVLAGLVHLLQCKMHQSAILYMLPGSRREFALFLYKYLESHSRKEAMQALAEAIAKFPCNDTEVNYGDPQIIEGMKTVQNCRIKVQEAERLESLAKNLADRSVSDFEILRKHERKMCWIEQNIGANQDCVEDYLDGLMIAIDRQS